MEDIPRLRQLGSATARLEIIGKILFLFGTN